MNDAPIYDTLTGAYTRALFSDQLHAEVERVRRYGQPCSLIVFDLDHFKSINDAFGHARGDEVLAEVARRTQRTKRASDQLFRYGGDEFVVLLPSTAKAEATRLAQRLLDAVRGAPFAGAPPLSLSLSLGVATCPTDATEASALFERADARNYLAKRRGRACVVADDAGDAPTLPFAELARLVERDAATEAALRFLADLAAQRRGVLGVIGTPGAGRTRFLAEVARRAQLQGCAVLALQGSRAQRTTPYGALTRALPELAATPPAHLTLTAVQQALTQRLAGADQLLLCVDDLPDLDWGTLDLIRQLLATTELPVLGLAYTSDPGSARVAAPFATPLVAQVALAPLSPGGLRIWLRMLLQWEPPAALVDWLDQQAHGAPAHVERALRRLVSAGSLSRHAQGWQFSPPEALAADPALAWHGPAPRHNLPAALTSFIGREQELAELRPLLATSRLLTLTGAGGMGKTRLALQAAAELLDAFSDGVWLVELAPLADPALLPYTVAAALGVREEHGRPLIATLADWLRPKRLLLLLDNCEHLIDACAQLADRVLRAGPDVRILATSREPLDIAGELVYRVPSLGAPQQSESIAPAQLGHYPAARLFIERATFAQAGFQIAAADAPLIAQICAQLDGIPLAIELAAARTRTLSVAEIATRLGDRFELLAGGNRAALPRHQTLRALIDWSYALLAPAERVLLERLAVFNGGWVLAAAEAVCSNQAGEPADVAALLAQLVDKSLVVSDGHGGEPRYHLLETIRQYAREQQADPHERTRLRDRHLAYFTWLAEQAEPVLISAQRATCVQRLAGELDNLRAALEWACDQHPSAARWLAGLLGWFWYFGDLLNEGRAWHLRALASESAGGYEQQGKLSLARALASAGMISGNLGYIDEARPWLERSIVLCQALGAQRWLAEAVFSLAYVLVQRGDDAQAFTLLESHAALLHTAADPLIEGWALAFWGRALANARGDYAAAKRLHDQGVALGQANGDAGILGNSFMNLGHWAAQQGDYAAAYTYHSESLAWRRRAGTRLHVAISSHYVADMLSMQGRYEPAQALYAEALALSRALGDQAFIAWTSYRLGYVAAHQGNHGPAFEHLAESLDLYRTQKERALITSGLAGFAELWRVLGQPLRAARLLGCVAAHPQSAQRTFVSAVDRVEYERTLGALRVQLDVPAFAAAWAAGQALTLDQASLLARQLVPLGDP